MFYSDVNYIALFIAGVANMVVGSIWYGPLFGKMWMKLAGLSKKDIEGSKDKMPMMYGTSFVASLVTAYILAMLVNFLNVVTVVGGVKLGFFVWLGFAGATSLPHYLFSGWSLKLFKINTGYTLASLVVMGAIIAMMS